MLPMSPAASAARSPAGKTQHLEHITQPFVSARFSEPTPEQLADEYVAAMAGAYQLDDQLVSDLAAPVPVSDRVTNEGAQLHRARRKDMMGASVVVYEESFRGLPVWGADLAVHIASNPMRVTSSTSTLSSQIALANDPAKVLSHYTRKLSPALLAGYLGLDAESSVAAINGMRPVIFQYWPDQRLEDSSADDPAFGPPLPMPPLPPVPDGYVAGGFYAVVEILFDLAGPEWDHVHWRAMVDPQTGAVLYLRAAVGQLAPPAPVKEPVKLAQPLLEKFKLPPWVFTFPHGMIFKMDPISLTGDAALIPSASEAALSACRSDVLLWNLNSHSPQDLNGAQVDIAEIEDPVAAEPVQPSPPNFEYAVKTTEFAAVNAYYHVNWFFHLMEGMGFDLATYFGPETAFPVPVDHWGRFGAVNAHCMGTPTFWGLEHFCFGVAQAGQTVGIADDVRVVIHEFGHGLLYPHVGAANFGFAHSAGDGLGAILLDPESLAPDRFLTFPWPQSGGGPLDRRHDRDVAAGWAWFGSHWNTGYGGEQVLSTTLFRIYRAVGGDSPHPADRAWASRYVAYLILKAIGLMHATTTMPEVFATSLMEADITTADFEGQPGGALHKVIHWAFEKQGLYQPDAVYGTVHPPTTRGLPPEVDVYIDDGRHGEYDYLYAFWESQDMWVRKAPDGGLVHQEPTVGQPAYMYVKVKNRGTQPANNVAVKAYHCNPGAGLLWPDHWVPMDTVMLAAPAPIPPGGEATIGPFQWTPDTVDHECLLAIASATGDAANDTLVAAPIPHARFVPFDNNIGQRNIHPVAGGTLQEMIKRLQRQELDVYNPYTKPVQVELLTVVEPVLQEQGYEVVINSAGGRHFQMGPLARQPVVFSVGLRAVPAVAAQVAGEPVRRKAHIIPKPGIRCAEEMLDENRDGQGANRLGRTQPMKVRIVMLVDGQNMGGITCLLQAKGQENLGEPVDRRVEPAPERPVENLAVVSRLRELVAAQAGVKQVRVRGVNLYIELED